MNSLIKFFLPGEGSSIQSPETSREKGRERERETIRNWTTRWTEQDGSQTFGSSKVKRTS